MARQAFADDLAGFDVERGEQRGRAVALVIMGHGSGATLLERQSRLGPVECLNLRLLIHAQHDRPVRRVEVKPCDPVTFSSKSGSFETLNPFVICGLRPASAQMRPTLDGEIPMANTRADCLQSDSD